MKALKIGGIVIGAILGLWILGVVAGVISMPFKVIGGAQRVGNAAIEQTFDPQRALQNYRWFYAAYNQVEAKEAQIERAKAAVTFAQENTPDRVSARMTELTGLQNSCSNLVGQYNAKASDLTAWIFQDPAILRTIGEMMGQQSAADPLPQMIDQSVCN